MLPGMQTMVWVGVLVAAVLSASARESFTVGDTTLTFPEKHRTFALLVGREISQWESIAETHRIAMEQRLATVARASGSISAPLAGFLGFPKESPAAEALRVGLQKSLEAMSLPPTRRAWQVDLYTNAEVERIQQRLAEGQSVPGFSLDEETGKAAANVDFSADDDELVRVPLVFDGSAPPEEALSPAVQTLQPLFILHRPELVDDTVSFLVLAEAIRAPLVAVLAEHVTSDGQSLWFREAVAAMGTFYSLGNILEQPERSHLILEELFDAASSERLLEKIDLLAWQPEAGYLPAIEQAHRYFAYRILLQLAQEKGASFLSEWVGQLARLPGDTVSYADIQRSYEDATGGESLNERVRKLLDLFEAQSEASDP